MALLLYFLKTIMHMTETRPLIRIHVLIYHIKVMNEGELHSDKTNFTVETITHKMYDFIILQSQGLVLQISTHYFHSCANSNCEHLVSNTSYRLVCVIVLSSET